MNKAPFMYGLAPGALPDFPGRVFYAAPGSGTYYYGGVAYTANDNNDGLDPRRATASIQKCVTYASTPADYSTTGANFTAAPGDIICLFPGSHAPTAAIPLNVPGLSIIGMLNCWYANPQSAMAIITAPAASQAFQVTAANVELGQLQLVAATTAAAVTVSAAGTNFHLHDFIIDMETAAANTGTKGVVFSGAALKATVERGQIYCNAAQGPAFDITATLGAKLQNLDFVLRGNATWANTILVGAATLGFRILNCTWEVSGTGAITAAIDGTGSTIAKAGVIANCIFDVLAVAVKNFGAGGAALAQNYQAQVGAGAGGAVITVIT